MKNCNVKLAALATTAALCIPAIAGAALTINVGNVTLQPNLAGQVRSFNVTSTGNDPQVDGLEFDIQVGDGGAALGGTDTGPVISSIDLVNGTIFAGGSQANPSASPLAAQSTVDLNGGLVTASGLIAKVTFDTTGMNTALTEPLKFDNVAGSFNTHFVDANGAALATTINDGTISIVTPEPASAALFAIGAAGLLLIRRRRQTV